MAEINFVKRKRRAPQPTTTPTPTLSRPPVEGDLPEIDFVTRGRGGKGRKPKGLGTMVAHGARSGVSVVGGMLDMPRQFLEPGGGMFPTGQVQPQLTAAADHALRKMGIPYEDPIYLNEHIIEGSVSGLLQALPTAAAPWTKGARVRELVSGVTGELGSRAAEGMGAGGLGQFAGGLAGGLAPLALTPAALAVGARAGENLVAPWRHGVARQEAGQVLADAVPSRSQAVEMLTREIDDPPYGIPKTTAQTLDPVSPEVRNIEASVARRRPRIQQELRQQRTESLEGMSRRYEADYPVGDEFDAPRAYDEGLEEIQGQVSDAYKQIGPVTEVPTRKLKVMADLIREESGPELREWLPSQLDLVDQYGEAVDFDSLRRLRTSLSASRRGLSGPAGLGEAPKLRNLNRMIDAVESTWDELADSTKRYHLVLQSDKQVEALRDAIALRARQGDVFNHKSPAYKAMMDYEQPADGFRALMGGKAPVEEIRRLKRAFGDNPAADAGLRKLMRDYVFGEEFLGAGELSIREPNVGVLSQPTKAAERTLVKPKVRAAMREVFGPEADRNALSFVRRLYDIQVGKVGSSGAPFASTGRNAPDIDVSRLADIQGLARMLIRSMGREATEEEVYDLLAGALVDKQLARGLFEESSPAALRRWELRASQVMSAAARARAATGTRDE